MVVQSRAWEQVGERFEALGEHLRGHFEEAGADASAERAAFEKSVRGLLAALEDGFGAAGKAVRDPALRQDVASVATSVREALLTTFEAAGEQVRERLSRPRRVQKAPAKRATTARTTAPRKTVAAKATTAKTTTAKTTTGKTTPRKRAAG